MIQKSIVTFYDPDAEQTIKIKFQFAVEQDYLDYSTEIEPELKEEDHNKINFILATTFMNSLLVPNQEDTEIKDNGKPEGTEA